MRRHCNNAVVGETNDTDNNNADTTDYYCNDDETRPHRRQMKTRLDWATGTEIKSHMCCDSIIDNKANKNENFFDETDCVPYIDTNYTRSYFKNYYGNIYAMTCKEPESGFLYPSLVSQHNNDTMKRYDHYECCKTDRREPPFIRDLAFKFTIYPTIVTSSIGVLLCGLLIVGLLIPLWLKRKTSSSTPLSSPSQCRYSPYTLYLLYLSISDLIFSLYVLLTYSRYAGQKYNPSIYGYIVWNRADFANFECGASSPQIFEGSFMVGVAGSSLYLNAVIAYEILALLRDCNQIKRRGPPPLIRVTIQAIVVYIIAALVSVVHYFVVQATLHSSKNHNNITACTLFFANEYFFVMVLILLIPVGYLCYVSITIWRCSLLPLATKGMRELAWFYFRIVLVFLLTWFPGMLLLDVGAFGSVGNSNQPYANVGILLLTLQPTLSVCLAITKSDVRKYLCDLVTLSYCKKESLSDTV